MTGAWKGGDAWSNATSIGATLATSNGTTLNGSTSTTFTKGTWTQLIASTATDLTALLIVGQTFTSGGTAFAVDIGVGPGGSQSSVINNLNFSQVASSGASYLFPLNLPAGTSLWGRVSCNDINDAMVICVNAFQDLYTSAGTGSAIDTYGFSTATNLGTLVDPGATANTKGAYSQITASVTSDLAGILLAFDLQGLTGGTVGAVFWLIDIAVGAAGAEQVIIPNLYQMATTATLGSFFVPFPLYLPIQIPSGTRVAVRAQCSTNVSPDRLMGITLYGVRQ